MPPKVSASPVAPRFRGVRALVFAALLGTSLVVSPLARAETAAAQPLSSQAPVVSMPSLAPLVKKVLPAVVNVSAIEKAGTVDADDDSDVPDDQGQPQDFDEDQGPGPGQGQGFPQSPFDQFLKKFFEQQQPGGRGHPVPHDAQRVALGSGFIIDPTGYVVTNNHVVANSDKVTVIFQDDSKHPAKVIGRDTKTDIALLKIETSKPLPYVSFGDSTASQVGDWVLAVGNPFGLGGTVSSGIISALGRDIHAGPYDDFLQIDASINRGNSGGPTFNLNGEVIGINTAIYSPNGGSVGIGFAIPSSLAKPVIEQLKAHGKVERGWLGVQIQEVTPEIAKGLGLAKPEGALVADVTENGPAAKAGIKQGDVITAFDGHPIRHVRDLPIVVAETKVGEKANVKVWRKDAEVAVEPTIATMPDNPKMAANDNGATPEAVPQKTASALGLKLAPLDQDWRQKLHVAKQIKGVVVTGVSEKSPFAELGLQPGDVIQAIDQEPVTLPLEVATKLDAAKKSKAKSVLLLINRNGSNAYVALSLDKTEDKG